MFVVLGNLFLSKQPNVFEKYLKVIIITAKMFSVIITITLHVFEKKHDYNYIWLLWKLYLITDNYNYWLRLPQVWSNVNFRHWQGFPMDKNENICRQWTTFKETGEKIYI